MNTTKIWTPGKDVPDVTNAPGSTMHVYTEKLKQCTPDKYVVAMADDVVLTPEEWLDLMDYTRVVAPWIPKGEIHLLRKAE